MAEDKVARLEARTALLPPEAVELDAQREAVVAAEPVAQLQAVAVMQPGVRPLAASVELAETAAVRLWIRGASFLVRAPEEPVVPAAKEQGEVDPGPVVCRLLAAAVDRLILVAVVGL